MPGTRTGKQQVTASEVRAWARRRGFSIGQRGHLPKEVVGAFNRAHRAKEFTNSNPWLAQNKEPVSA